MSALPTIFRAEDWTEEQIAIALSRMTPEAIAQGLQLANMDKAPRVVSNPYGEVVGTYGQVNL